MLVDKIRNCLYMVRGQKEFFPTQSNKVWSYPATEIYFF